jgi:DNA/RNA endonuclease YhcR with UshA esterase domain
MRLTSYALAIVVVCLATLIGVAQQDVKPITPTQATKKINEKCTVEMLVASVGKSGKAVFLNSKENFRDDDNFTVFINGDGIESFKQAKIDNIGEHFKGKTILVTGTVTLYQDRPQIAVEKAGQVQIREKK